MEKISLVSPVVSTLKNYYAAGVFIHFGAPPSEKNSTDDGQNILHTLFLVSLLTRTKNGNVYILYPFSAKCNFVIPIYAKSTDIQQVNEQINRVKTNE
jgi:hypothetical protein